MTELDYKLQFAALLQKVPKSKRMDVSIHIAKETIGTEQCEKYPRFLLQIANEWPFDPIVIAEIERIEMIPIPKEVVLKELYAIATDKFIDAKDRVAAFKVYADTNGWTKPVADKGLRDDDKLKELAAMILEPSELTKLEGIN